MEAVREVVRLGRILRKREGYRVRQPLRSLTVLSHETSVLTAVQSHAEVIASELNVKSVRATSDESSLVELSAKANFRKLGPLLGNRMQEMAEAIRALAPADLQTILDGGTLNVLGVDIGLDDVAIERNPREGTVVETGVDLACALDTTVDDALLREGFAREIISRVQRNRRELGLAVTDRIILKWHSEDPEMLATIGEHAQQIASEVLASAVEKMSQPVGVEWVIDGRPVWLEVTPNAP